MDVHFTGDKPDNTHNRQFKTTVKSNNNNNEDIIIRDIQESNNHITIVVEVPFALKKDIHVRASQTGIDIFSKIDVEKEYRRGDTHTWDKTQRLIHKHIILPYTINQEQLQTNYQDDTLIITLTKQ